MSEGKDHKLMKKKVSQEYEKKGYNTQVEYKLSNDKIVDVLASNNEEKIGIEVGDLQGKNREDVILEELDKFIHYPQFGKNFGHFRNTNIVCDRSKIKDGKCVSIDEKNRIYISVLRNTGLLENDRVGIDVKTFTGIIYDPDTSYQKIIRDIQGHIDYFEQLREVKE